MHPDGVCPYAPKKATPTPTKITIDSVKIASADLSIVAGEDKTLSAIISPEDATNKSITWSSSDTNIATINNDGLITAKSSGTTIITASAYNGKSHSITINVNEKEEISSINSPSETSSEIEEKILKDQKEVTVTETNITSSPETNKNQSGNIVVGLGLIG